MAFTKIVGAGIQTTTDVTVRNVQAGIVTATKFIGDISEATGAAAGLGTALSQVQSSPLNKIYFTNQVLSIGSTITVDPPDSSNIAYTQYAEIAVEEGYDLIVEDGDDLIPDILGLSTVTAAPLSGAGGRVRADQFTNKAGTGAPTFPNGVQVTGVSTLGNTVVGGGTTQLVVTGNARITGILTIGTDSITLDGSNNQVNVGTAVTINSSGVTVTGVITATSFSGSGANLTGIAATTDVRTNSLVVSGITTVAAGSTAAPSITPTGDNNTGIFFPSADTIAFGEGGAEAARIDSSGRLLLGTSSAPSPGGNVASFVGANNANTSTTSNLAIYSNTAQAANVGGAISLGGYWTTASDFFPFGSIAGRKFNSTSNDAEGYLQFNVSDNSFLLAEAMRINSQRELLIGTTTRTANGGTLQISNGITFPATQSACSDVNTLDDYEEGTWTPVVKGTSTAGTASYLLQIGRYTKVGRLVTVDFIIECSSGTGTGDLFLDGLPFTSANTHATQPAVSLGIVHNIALTANHVMTARVPWNTQRIQFLTYPAGGGVSGNVGYDAAGSIGGSAFYYV